MKFALVLLGICAFYLVNATGDLETELEASELQELQEALDLIGETSLESLEAEELEEARKFKWGKLFSAAKKLYKKGKKLSKNKNFKKALKFGKQLAKNLQAGEEHEPGTPVGNNKCWAIGTTCSDDCDCCPEHHCHCPAGKWLPGLFRCTCQVTESDKVNKCPPAE
uniref:Spiderine-1b n=1 Tax=Oxyopes takobius TaxID=666126 RepID=SPN1B_OXYTA|nr:RecName: Full=Spiderine-1b; AltName: Full=M-oxotoxin-Ot3b; Short=M-OXTX-Ot3b; AltName: Full=OtTx1b; Flags: Precursor [Oxyopes takobius]AGG39773.1 Tx-1b precursor [Oxyopes takobius]